MWRIELLGGLRARSDGRLLEHFRTQKNGMLLAYLAYHRRRTHPREALIELLWPECEPHAGKNNLSKELSWLRDQLEPPGVPPGAVLVADRTSVRLNPDAVMTDVAVFEATLQAAERSPTRDERRQILARAVEQYGGELLAGHHDDWVLGARQWLAERHQAALRELLALPEAAGDVAGSLEAARRWVNADPVSEEANQALIRLLDAAGQPAAALRQYAALERLLREQLQAAPGPATRELAHSIERRAILSAAPHQSGDWSVVSGEAGKGTTTRTAPASPPLTTHHSPLSSGAREPVGGAMPVDSPFYVVRATDGEFHAAIARRDSIVLVKGARQMGKSSLLARGIQQARDAGIRVVLTDVQMLNESQLESVAAFLFALAQCLAVELDLDVPPQAVWNADSGPNINFELYLRRQVLGKEGAPVLWALDEVDRLFPRSFGSEVFGLFRSWHNRRSLDPGGPWPRFTMAMAYATEAHLFITDLNQSPFNVGTRLTLHDFTLEQVADLNRRYDSPLRDDAELDRFFHMVGGQPYLVQRGLHEMAAQRLPVDGMRAAISRQEWPFRDHLQRMRVLLLESPELCEAVREVLDGRPCPTPESFYRLRSAGVLAGESPATAQPRCWLYAEFLRSTLP